MSSHLNKWKIYITSIILLNLTLLILFGVYNISTEVNFFNELLKINSKRKPDIYRENYTKSASIGKINRVGNGFEFIYQKSTQIEKGYVAAYFPIEDLVIDFKDYDQLSIGIKTEKGRRVPVHLSMHYGDTLVRYLSYFIDISSEKTIYKINLNEFKTPPEWFLKHNLSLSDLPPPNFNNIKTISLESCHLLKKGESDQYQISEILLNRNVNTEIWLLVSLDIVLMIMFYIFMFNPFEKELKVIHIPVVTTINNSKNSSNTELEKISSFLSSNYTDPDLTLRKIQKLLGIKGQKISELIKEEYLLSFPQYIAKLRIEEAKRLFINGEFESISQVAYDVGFNSPNNFNRVFKAHESKSPKQFLESLHVDNK